jgi:transcriptional regulator with GAF, ATPase, and Fis domain
MRRHLPLLLEVWREVCRHTDIGESVSQIANLVGKRLAAELMLVRHLDPGRNCVETLAVGRIVPGDDSLRPRNDCSATDVQRILVWSKSGDVLRGPFASLDRDLPGLLPAGLGAEALALPLSSVEGPAGALVFGARRAFQPRHEDLARLLLEPLGVALENDRRLRGITALREAVEADNRSLLSRLGRHDISDSIVGAETGLRHVMEQIELVSHSEAPVLILGETGSGKEVIARAIHTRSRRASGPFLRVNCGAIPPELVDSELFGHDKGSFTGAVAVRQGWFERADAGTLFLDECGELPLAAQVRLLRILQDGTFERVGGERQLHVDVRIVAATHRDLSGLVAQGQFRADLWYRIAVFPISLPPLRERQEDIAALATHFALRAAKRLGVLPLIPSAEDLDLLIAYPWPGNIRELAAVIERAAILGGGGRLEVAKALGTPALQGPKAGSGVLGMSNSLLHSHGGKTPAPAFGPGDGFPPLNQAMARHIESALARTRGRIEGPDGAARLLGINPHTLRARMNKLGVDWRSFRSPRY